MAVRAKRVLIVDDALSDRTLLSVSFKKAGYKVYLAKNGVEAYLKFFKLKPDIVLADIILPKMRGDTLIKWIKGTAPGREVPFIVISSHGQMKDYLYELGIEVFFQKPCKTAEVLEAAEEILKIYESKKALSDRIGRIKGRYGKTPEPEDQGMVKYKLCEVCQNITAMRDIRCPNCTSVRLNVIEILDSLKPPPNLPPLPRDNS